jgi:hypothetical protein
VFGVVSDDDNQMDEYQTRKIRHNDTKKVKKVKQLKCGNRKMISG